MTALRRAATTLAILSLGQGGGLAAQARPTTNAAPVKLDTTLLAGLKARAIGPAIMGGRTAAIALDPKDPYTFYVGLGTGGVMKTTDNGDNFDAIFTDQPVVSVGAIAVAPSDPKVVWVGTGEANDRNSSQWGDGVYLSRDGGSSWTHVGLDSSRTIPRIVVSPRDPNTAWVAVMGDLWRPSSPRGLFKTTDGGKTWRQVLKAPAPYGDRVGAGDVAIDPKNPDVLYAALYARMRRPWSFAAGPLVTDGKDLGGVFKSTDGGETWTKLAGGLPSGTKRIGLAVAASDPSVVYAEIETDVGGAQGMGGQSKAGGIFRSSDAGATWTRVSDVDPRPFYFSQIRVAPDDPNKVYVLGEMLLVSPDGGKSWREDRFGKVHPDTHALEIDPRSPKRMLLGTDGGVYQTFDGGAHWAHLNRFAAGAFYRVAVDSAAPYRICGGLQDNINWVGPSQTNTDDGIVNADWTPISGGDGFYCAFGAQPNIVYSESQEGTVYRYDLNTGQYTDLRPIPPEGQPAYRFHWNSPLMPSAHEKGALYLAGNHVFKLTDRGEHARVISPDLSRQELPKIIATGSGAENYGVVYTLDESPVKAGLLWAGTDDGRLWVTRDDGGHWTELTQNLPKAARGWMQRVEASHFDPDVAYLAVSGYRDGDYRPLLYRTADGGKTWTSIAAGLPKDGPVEVITEDTFNPDLLFAGTMFGLFVSGDRGATWARYPGLPTVTVDDVVEQDRTHDLVIATHGRSLYVLDDIRALEGLTPAIRQQPAHMFSVPDATATGRLEGFSMWNGTAIYRGANPSLGMPIDYYVRDWTGKDVSVKVESDAGVPIATLSGPGTPGFHRLYWDLRPGADVLNDYGGLGRRFVPPGTYGVSFSYGDVKQEQKVKVTAAPGIETRGLP